MGESIAEATIAKWLKKPGESVKKDEVILEISTDKVDSEIPAPEAGTLVEVLFSEGAVVPVKEKIAVIDTSGGAASAPSQAIPSQSAAPQPAQSSNATSTNGAHAAQRPVSEESAASNSGKFYSPVVRSLAEKHGISLRELDSVSGSGQGGRLTKQDFMDYVNGGQQKTSPAQASQPAQGTSQIQSSPKTQSAPPSVRAGVPAVQAQSKPDSEWIAQGHEVVPMDNMRRLIADHMVRSKATSPHVYSVQEIDCSRIALWRNKHKDAFKKREGFGLSFTPFFLEAAVKALQEFPLVNSSVDGSRIIMKKDINLGCAVALGNSGLIVPVIKKADEKNFVGIARSLNDLALRARDKKLLPDEVTNGTFTVTNPGVFGTMIGTPIINQPQVAILCLGAIKKRPVVVDDMIGIREICYLTLSYDHRIIDGSLGGQFLAYIREYLEAWDIERSLN
jgi:2-oxoglutarate dehydrogenase E2 component (dihydrolipoamide succinyltransferase)